MPGVIQPQRPQGSLQNALSLGGTIMQAKGAFGGGSPQPGAAPEAGAAQSSAGNVGGPDQAAQGQAVQPYQTYNQQDPYALAPWAQRRVSRSGGY